MGKIDCNNVVFSTFSDKDSSLPCGFMRWWRGPEM